MSTPFFDRPILNSPYEPPTAHHSLDSEGQPLDEEPKKGRRPSALLSPVPMARRRRSQATDAQHDLNLGAGQGSDNDGQAYDPTPVINRIRQHLEDWRKLSNPVDWKVTPTTALSPVSIPETS